MAGFNAIPAASGGGGGIPSMNFVGSIYMSTFNRTWAQGGTPGYFGIYSANQESGYAYFVGASVTTGVPLNKMSNITHAFTSINIVAPLNDLVSLYKVKVKNTTLFTNGLETFPYTTTVTPVYSTMTTSQTYMLPAGGLGLVNAHVIGGGGGGAHYGGGGGGGGIIKLSGFPVGGSGVVVTIGAAGVSSGAGTAGGTTYFGPVSAAGGGFGLSGGSGGTAGSGANGGGGSYHSTRTAAGSGVVPAAGTGPLYIGTPTFQGGHNGGSSSFTGADHYGDGGGGAGGTPAGRTGTGSVAGGVGHASDISGTTRHYGSGGGGSQHSSPSASGTYATEKYIGAGGQGTGSSGVEQPMSGGVIVKAFTP